jgi:hypothetical protein
LMASFTSLAKRVTRDMVGLPDPGCSLASLRYFLWMEVALWWQ